MDCYSTDSWGRVARRLLILSSLLLLPACSGSSGGSGGGGSDDVIRESVSISPISGMRSLTVTADANSSNLDFSGVIASYQWDFGDGTVYNTASATHTYHTSGAKPVTLTVTTNENVSYSVTDTVFVFDPIDNTTATPGNISSIFFDGFDYTVQQNDNAYAGGLDNPFVNIGGWNAAKAINISGGHNGYIYTVTEIPGYSGDFPGLGSSRALAIESLGGSMCEDPSNVILCQTDIYLEFGDGTPDIVPADVWFQFWIYPAKYNDPTNQHDQVSAYHSRSKFIYPCNGAYPCDSGNLKWLFMLGHEASNPTWVNQDDFNRQELYMTTIDPYNISMVYAPAESYNQFKLGQTSVADYLKPNRWTLVKLHFDTSGAQGIYQAWLKPLGGAWLQVAEWNGATTPDFTWPLDNVGGAGGHNKFRMPTTIDRYDSWHYLDDFSMATTEAGLPTYPY